MGRISLEQASKLNEGGSKYFKLNADESKQVRFLWDSFNEVGEKWCFGVHELYTTAPDGQKSFNTIDCPSASDASAHCKYCAGEVLNGDNKRSAQVGRVIIPIYNIEEECIQYWKRSTKWVTNTLKPVLDEVANIPSIANQTFKIKRTGSGLNDTTYTVLPVMNASDNRTKADFGEVEDPYDLGMISKYGEGNQQPQGQQVQGQAATSNYQPRRTTEVF